MNNSKKIKTKDLLIDLTLEHYAQLKIISFKRQLTMPDLLNTIITEYLDNHRKEYENEFLSKKHNK